MRSVHLLSLVCGLVLGASSVSAAPAGPDDFAAEADAILDAAFPAAGPGVSVVVMRAGQPV